MLNLVEMKPEHEALMKVIIQKINDLYAIQSLFQDSEDKFLAGWALKNAALYLNTLILNGKVMMPAQPPEPPKEAVNDDVTLDDTKPVA